MSRRAPGCVHFFNAINRGPRQRSDTRSGERIDIPLAGDDGKALEVAQRWCEMRDSHGWSGHSPARASSCRDGGLPRL